MTTIDSIPQTVASRTPVEIARLFGKNRLFRFYISSRKYEQEFQKWVEELLYQFDKTVIAIYNSPPYPINDAINLRSFLRLIEKNKLGTSLIRGIENKELFDQVLLKTKSILEEFIMFQPNLDKN